MLEYGFTCSEIEIGASAYSCEDKAIRFYEHRDSLGGLRLTFTPGRMATGICGPMSVATRTMTTTFAQDRMSQNRAMHAKPSIGRFDVR